MNVCKFLCSFKLLNRNKHTYVGKVTLGSKGKAITCTMLKGIFAVEHKIWTKKFEIMYMTSRKINS